ncbi:hypothetical protein J4050_00065 [Winogradskyella sp. DF17]|uniref:Uncharacterized protein n=1 Tax=Winogradskyella pelagia TaxID=2819984 RepID=A0ABS3SYJ7_9FLAO|nr:hypothetical protein [Winogradskyella sp. DF17]MBO3115119.1 hypothetical protein [Winogradskyella sp. DF17]
MNSVNKKEIISKVQNKSGVKWKVISMLSIVCALLPSVIFSLWIYTFNQESNPIHRKVVFRNYFPDALHGRWDITYLAIVCCILAIILSGWIKEYCPKVWRRIHIFIILISSILLLLFGITLL